MKNNEGKWIKGLSWTPGRLEETTNPDDSRKLMWVHSGPFYFNPDMLGCVFHRFGRLECYAGFRPTAPWSIGGNEGLFVPFKRLMQKMGASNLAFALRLKESTNE